VGGHLWLVSSTVRPLAISWRITPHSARRAPGSIPVEGSSNRMTCRLLGWGGAWGYVLQGQAVGREAVARWFDGAQRGGLNGLSRAAQLGEPSRRLTFEVPKPLHSMHLGYGAC